MNTLLLVGGDLCMRTAALLDPGHWKFIGLRRRPMTQGSDDRIVWHRANAETYPFGLARVLSSLPRRSLDRLQRCVLVGSSAVWGPSDDWVDEDTPVQNTNFRATSLLDAEAAMGARIKPGTGCTLRLSGLYGPGRLRLIDGLAHGTVTAPEGPGHWANRLHIDDAARACAHLLTLPDPAPVYIGTDAHPRPTAELYDALADLAGVARPVRQARPPSGKRLSNARLRASGWTPEWPDAVAGYTACLAAPTSGHQPS